MGSQKPGIVKTAAKEVANEIKRKILRKILLKLFLAVGWQPLLILLAFAAVFGPIMSVANGIYNFMGNPRPDAVSDQALKTLYDGVSAGTVDASLLANDPGLAMYRVPWSLFAAIDKVQNNCETPQPEYYAGLLRPTVHMKNSVIKTVTTVVDSDSGSSSSTDNETIQLVDTANTYKGTFRHNYTPSTTTTSSSVEVERSRPYTYDATDEITGETLLDPLTGLPIQLTGSHHYTATIVTTVDVTKDIIYNIQQPMPADYTRLINALVSFGITNKSDHELVWEIARSYEGQDVDLTQPVNYLMGLGGGGGVEMGYGAAPPPSWVPWFLAGAQLYHGSTSVEQFEALLMAIAFTESSFSESRDKVSYADARGPFQFTDPTWYDYGVRQLGYAIDDVWIASKAVMAAGLMLAQAGADRGDLGGIRSALWRYNQSEEYGNLVLGRMYYYGSFTGWTPDIGMIEPGSASTQGFYWPVPGFGTISSPFGPRIHPVTGKAGMHTGIDIPAPLMAPIITAKDGVVEVVDTHNSVYGYKILIRHEGGVETLYGHIQDIAPGIVEGRSVNAGDVIAYVGTRGVSTGNHLHFEVHYNDSPVNPLLFINQP